jgi:hypothetical protein
VRRLGERDDWATNGDQDAGTTIYSAIRYTRSLEGSSVMETGAGYPIAGCTEVDPVGVVFGIAHFLRGMLSST